MKKRDKYTVQMEMCTEIQEIRGEKVYEWKTKGQLNMKFTYFTEIDYGDGKHIHFLWVPLDTH